MARERVITGVVTLDPRFESLRASLPDAPATIHVHGRTGSLAVVRARLDEAVTIALPDDGARVVVRLGDLKSPGYRFEPDPNADPDDEEQFWSESHALELMRWATARIRVCTPAGAPIPGVIVRVDGESGATDAVGVVELPAAIGSCAFGVDVPRGLSIRSGPERVIVVADQPYNDVIVCLEPTPA